MSYAFLILDFLVTLPSASFSDLKKLFVFVFAFLNHRGVSFQKSKTPDLWLDFSLGALDTADAGDCEDCKLELLALGVPVLFDTLVEDAVNAELGLDVAAVRLGVDVFGVELGVEGVPVVEPGFVVSVMQAV